MSSVNVVSGQLSNFARWSPTSRACRMKMAFDWTNEIFWAGSAVVLDK